MKKLLPIVTLLLAAQMLCAQPGHRHRPAMPQVPVSIQASNNEAFVVYVDGAPVNSRSEHGVDVSIDDRDQTLYIRLKRPEDRIVSLELIRGRIHPFYVVRYDAQRDELSIVSKDPPRQVVPPAPGRPGPERSVASRADVKQLLKDMDKAAFRDDKMMLAKSFVGKVIITTDQAIDIAKAFDFDDDKAEFLVYAYDFVTDKQNYRRTVEAVTFTANKERLFKLVTRR